MRQILGSPRPLFPSSGYFRCEGERMEWSEDNLAAWNLYFTSSGAGEVILENGVMEVKAGDLLVLPPGLARTYRVAKDEAKWEFHWLHFHPTTAVAKELPWFRNLEPSRHEVHDLSQRMRLTSTLDEINRINLQSPDLIHRVALVNALIDSVLLRAASSVSRRRRESRSIDPRIAKATERIHRNLAANLTVEHLAGVSGLSRSQFSLLFKQGTGLTPMQYLEKRRLDLACFYLSTTALSVAQVAAAVGFEEPFYFTNRFRRTFGKSPSRYRQQPRAD